jgi:hypothetical protein
MRESRKHVFFEKRSKKRGPAESTVQRLFGEQRLCGRIGHKLKIVTV